jgi:hypothetical protein
MDFITKIITTAQSMEDPHTWSKFGATMRAERNDPTIEKSFVSKDPVKKRVFAVGVAFWLSIILVGGSYVLIEGVSNEKVAMLGNIWNKTLVLIKEDIFVEDYVDDTGSGFKLIENEDLSFEVQIPAIMEVVEESAPMIASFTDPIDETDARTRMILVEKSGTSSEIEINSYVDHLSPSYSGQNFLLIEESETELNLLPAKKYIYEFDDNAVRMRAVHIILVEKVFVYKFIMYDNVEDFPKSLSEFEISKESFFAW